MDWTLWRRWTITTTVAEIAGFCVPALAGAVVTATGLGSVPTFAVLLAAGFVEGLVLGTAQAAVLGGVMPRLSRQRFASATAVGATVAYAIGMAPSSLGDRLTTTSPAVLAPVTVVAAVVLLASIGTAQWLVLRRYGYNKPWWIATTAGAWLVGLSIFLLVATPLWQPGQSIGIIVAISAFAGALMAASVTALTGLAVVRLVGDRSGRVAHDEPEHENDL